MNIDFLRLGTWRHGTIRVIVGKVYIWVSWDLRRVSIDINWKG